MILWHLIILAIVQGLTDPLPISSSGHLVLFHHILEGGANNADQDRAVDIAVHIGTLGALVLFFWREVVRLTRGGLVTLAGRFKDEDSRLFQFLIVASIPAVIGGFLMSQVETSFFYDLERLAWMSLIFGILLGVADKLFPRDKDMTNLNFKSALGFGLMQVLSLIPGVSRSGITMTAGRFMGFDRVSAARFSLLMAIVVTAGAGTLGTYKVIKAGDVQLGMDFIVAIVFSFVASLGALALMMRWLQKFDFMPFVIYRVIFGVVVLGLLYAGYLQ